MKKLFLILSIFLVTTLSYANEHPDNITKIQAIHDLKEVCSTISKKYSYLKFKEKTFNLSWNQLCQEFERLLRNYQNDLISIYHFNQMLMDLTGRLNDYHTGVRTVYNLNGTYLKLGIQYVDGKYWLFRGNAEIYEKLKLNPKELKKKKFIVKSINGYTVEELTSLFPRSTYSNQLSSKTKNAGVLGRLFGANYLDYLNAFGKIKFDTSKTITLKLFSITDNKDLTLQYSPVFFDDKDDSDSPNTTCEKKYGYQFLMIEPDIGFLKIPTWYLETPDDLQCAWDFLMKSLSDLYTNKADKLIIDVRENGGGNVFWKYFISLFMFDKEVAISNVIKFHKPSFNGYFENEDGIPHSRPIGSSKPEPLWFSKECKSTKYTNITSQERTLIDEMIESNPLSHGSIFSGDSWSNTHFCFIYQEPNSPRIKIAVLIDRYGYSSNDQFASAMKSISKKDIILIGEPTMGGSGGGGSFLLKHSKFKIRHAMFANWSYNGKLIENFGSNPDIDVTWTIDNLVSNYDPFVETAIDWLHGTKSNKRFSFKGLYKPGFLQDKNQLTYEHIFPEF